MPWLFTLDLRGRPHRSCYGYRCKNYRSPEIARNIPEAAEEASLNLQSARTHGQGMGGHTNVPKRQVLSRLTLRPHTFPNCHLLPFKTPAPERTYALRLLSIFSGSVNCVLQLMLWTCRHWMRTGGSRCSFYPLNHTSCWFVLPLSPLQCRLPMPGTASDSDYSKNSAVAIAAAHHWDLGGTCRTALVPSVPFDFFLLYFKNRTRQQYIFGIHRGTALRRLWRLFLLTEMTLNAMAET